MGRRKKNTPVRKQDTFMSICKISGWLLFFIVITGIFTIIATNNLFEKHNADLVGIEPNYSYSDFVAEGFSRASLNAVAIIFVCLGVTFVLKYILHCKIDCTPIAVASCFIFIFYTAFSLTAAAPIFDYSPITDKVGSFIEQEKCSHSDFSWITTQDNKYKLSDIKVKPGRYKFVCPHCGKVFEEGYAVKVKGSKYKWDLVNKNNVSVSAYVSNEIELNYNERTHVHTSSDKCDSDLPMKFHHFGEYNACIGRYKHMIRFCKDCGYEDEKSQSSIFH